MLNLYIFDFSRKDTPSERWIDGNVDQISQAHVLVTLVKTLNNHLLINLSGSCGNSIGTDGNKNVNIFEELGGLSYILLIPLKKYIF